MLQQYLKIKQTELIQWGFPAQEGALSSPVQTETSPGKSFLKRVSNSPLCNSSPRASTVVLEKITKGTSAWVNSSVCVCPGYSWTCAETMSTSMDTEHESEQSVRQKLNERVRYRIRALLHLAEAPFISENKSRGRSEIHTTKVANSQQHKPLLLSLSWSWTCTVWNLILSQRRWQLLQS